MKKTIFIVLLSVILSSSMNAQNLVQKLEIVAFKNGTYESSNENDLNPQNLIFPMINQVIYSINSSNNKWINLVVWIKGSLIPTSKKSVKMEFYYSGKKIKPDMQKSLNDNKNYQTLTYKQIIKTLYSQNKKSKNALTGYLFSFKLKPKLNGKLNLTLYSQKKISISPFLLWKTTHISILTCKIK